MKHYSYIFLLIFLVTGACNHFGGDEVKTGTLPQLKPDYTNVTIPPNIAPLNFLIKEEGTSFRVIVTSEKNGNNFEITSDDGRIMFPPKKWRKFIEESKDSRIRLEVKVSSKEGLVNAYDAFQIEVAPEPVDSYLAYRLIPPGYYSWSGIRIMQRCLEGFSESTIVDNAILDKNCINCHSFANNDPEHFMVHIRGSNGGTYFYEDGKIRRTDPKVDGMPGSATYPSWHPGGRYVAYSSNQVRQSFYAESGSIEVFDIAGSMVVYDSKNNEILSVTEEDTADYLRTFPGWSPDGKYLYYCRAINRISPGKPEMADILNIHHDLVRKSFDETTRSFGKTEVVYPAAASGKSVSFPRISPDGKFLVFTLHDFGTFPIWHAEADLYSLDMANGKTEKLDLNSDDAESYHSWSSNSRWLVFSSKRSDGRSTRPYFAYINQDGRSSKPFMLPQRDPEYYDGLIESFNIPEFVTGKIKAGPRDFARATSQPAIKSKPGNTVEIAKNPQTEKNSYESATPAHQ